VQNGSGEVRADREISAKTFPVLFVDTHDKGRYHTLMAVRPFKSFFSTADELLTAELPRLGEVLLVHLNSYEDRVKQRGVINRDYLLAMLESRTVGIGTPPPPEYGDRQPDVTRRVMEAWDWLEEERMLMHAHQPGNCFSISGRGQEALKRFDRYERWEKLGLDQVKSDLEQTGGTRVVGGGPEVTQMAWDWVRMKQGEATLPAGKRSGTGGLPLIADDRLGELRKLPSPDFDLRKLIRLCEELNSSYDNGNYFATAMLTRGLLDHVPPLFGKPSFAEVANNYGGGGRSFKENMHNLENAARKVGDAHLHMPIRKSETLPTAQQVCFAPQIDVLLSEIVRMLR